MEKPLSVGNSSSLPDSFDNGANLDLIDCIKVEPEDDYNDVRDNDASKGENVASSDLAVHSGVDLNSNDNLSECSVKVEIDDEPSNDLNEIDSAPDVSCPSDVSNSVENENEKASDEAASVTAQLDEKLVKCRPQLSVKRASSCNKFLHGKVVYIDQAKKNRPGINIFKLPIVRRTSLRKKIDSYLVSKQNQDKSNKVESRVNKKVSDGPAVSKCEVKSTVGPLNQSSSESRDDALYIKVYDALQQLGEGSLTEICFTIVLSYATEASRLSFERLISEVETILKGNAEVFQSTNDKWAGVKDITHYWCSPKIPAAFSKKAEDDNFLREHDYCQKDKKYSKLERYTCIHCTFWSYYESQLKRHLTIFCKYKPKQKTFLRKWRNGKYRHYLAGSGATPQSSKIFCCMDCNFETPDKNKLRSHVLATHSGSDEGAVVSDGSPDKSASVESDGKDTAHTDENKTNGGRSVTPFNFRTRRKKLESSETVNNDKSPNKSHDFDCPKCKIRFYPYDNLMEHMISGQCLGLKVDRNTKSDVEIHERGDDSDSAMRSVSFDCEDCGRKFYQRNTLTRHSYLCSEKKKRKRHVENLERRPSEYDPTTDEVTSVEQTKNRSQEKRVDVYQCSSCGYKVSFTANEGKQGCSDDKYTCAECEFHTGNRSHLSFHTKMIHSSNVFRCARCGFAGSIKSEEVVNATEGESKETPKRGRTESETLNKNMDDDYSSEVPLKKKTDYRSDPDNDSKTATKRSNHKLDNIDSANSISPTGSPLKVPLRISASIFNKKTLVEYEKEDSKIDGRPSIGSDSHKKDKALISNGKRRKRSIGIDEKNSSKNNESSAYESESVENHDTDNVTSLRRSSRRKSDKKPKYSFVRKKSKKKKTYSSQTDRPDLVTENPNELDLVNGVDKIKKVDLKQVEQNVSLHRSSLKRQKLKDKEDALSNKSISDGSVRDSDKMATNSNDFDGVVKERFLKRSIRIPVSLSAADATDEIRSENLNNLWQVNIIKKEIENSNIVDGDLKVCQTMVADRLKRILSKDRDLKDVLHGNNAGPKSRDGTMSRITAPVQLSFETCSKVTNKTKRREDVRLKTYPKIRNGNRRTGYSSNRPIRIGKGSEMKFKCVYCDSFCVSMSKLIRHIKKFHRSRKATPGLRIRKNKNSDILNKRNNRLLIFNVKKAKKNRNAEEGCVKSQKRSNTVIKGESADAEPKILSNDDGSDNQLFNNFIQDLEVNVSRKRDLAAGKTKSMVKNRQRNGSRPQKCRGRGKKRLCNDLSEDSRRDSDGDMKEKLSKNSKDGTNNLDETDNKDGSEGAYALNCARCSLKYDTTALLIQHIRNAHIGKGAEDSTLPNVAFSSKTAIDDDNSCV